MRVNMFYLLWITVLLFASPVRGEVSPKKTNVSTIRQTAEVTTDSLQFFIQAGDSCMQQYNTFEALKHYRQAFDMADTYKMRAKLADCYYKRDS